MTRRLRKLFAENGPWAIYIIMTLMQNRIKLVFIRLLLREPGIYFQAPPRIIGRRSINFGERFSCGRGAWIEAIVGDEHPDRERIVIGDDVSVSDYFHLAAGCSVHIGDNALIGSGVLITDHGHGSYSSTGGAPDIPPNRRPLNIKGPVHIGKNVWIGDGVRILSGVRIGDNAVIAANTVVRENVPGDCVYGTPGHAGVLRVYDLTAGKWTSPGKRQ